MTATNEIDTGARFGFGENWTRFLADLTAEQIDEAAAALCEYLGVDSLAGKRFLDIGSGSGLSSLAARRLGATVVSFDYDPHSVACTQELRRRYYPDDPQWQVEQGSALDPEYLASLGTFDVVYSWGVLHHTGSMWLGIEYAIGRVKQPDGKLFIAIYNDQGWKSHVWWFIKAFYNRLPRWLRPAYMFVVGGTINVAVIIKHTLKLQPMTAIGPLLRDRKERGMSGKHDKVDWLGGFPFEFADFDLLVDYLRSRGFEPVKTRRETSLGCHEIVMARVACVE